MQSRIDGIAELIVMRNQSINASFTEFDKNSMIKSGIKISANWQSMLKHLLEDNKILSDLIRAIIADSEKISDFVAADFFTSQLDVLCFGKIFKLNKITKIYVADNCVPTELGQQTNRTFYLWSLSSTQSKFLHCT